MIGKFITETYLEAFIENALNEDIGDGDHSTLSTISSDKIGKAHLIFKEEGIVAGLHIARYIYEKLNMPINLSVYKNDGDSVEPGDIGYEVEGSVQAILSTERLILNILQRLSGIATFTRKLVDLIEGTGTILLDTRKTTPGLRALEKYAVKVGGGENHRFGLFDMIMLKDNHIDYAGGIAGAVKSSRDYLKTAGKDLRIEVETRNLADVKEALKNDR